MAKETGPLPWSPRQPRVAFGDGLVAHLSAKAVRVHGLSDGQVKHTIELGTGRGIGALKDGRLVVVDDGDDGRVLHVLSAKGADERFPAKRISTPVTGVLEVLADPRSAERFWVVGERRAQVAQYELTLQLESLAMPAFVDLARGTNHDVVITGDGAIVFHEAGAFHRLEGPEHTARKIPTKGRAVERLAADLRSPDRVWVASAEGVELVELGTEAKRISGFTPAHRAWDLAADDGAVAAILVEESAGDPPKFSLAVYDKAGKVRFTADLPGESHTLQVAISAKARAVAVADAKTLKVWDIAAGKMLIGE